MRKILKIFVMIFLTLLLCGQIFAVSSLIHNMSTSLVNMVLDIFTPIILGLVFSIIMVLLALIKHKNEKILSLGFLPVLIALFFIILGVLNISEYIIPPEVLFMFFMYIGLLFQVFDLNKKIGYIGCIILFLLVCFYIYIRPAYICESENSITKCGGRTWDWDKKICKSKIEDCIIH